MAAMGRTRALKPEQLITHQMVETLNHLVCPALEHLSVIPARQV
jgi:hypothetical protein